MKRLAQIKVGWVAAVVALALALPAHAEGKKKKEDVKLADCPAAVQQTIKDNAGGGEILEVEKATKKDGTVVYEAEVKKADGKKVDVKVAADGKLLQVENAEDNDQDNDKDDDQDDDKDNK